MLRRYSFSDQAAEPIEKVTQEASKYSSFGTTIHKASSFPSLTRHNSSPRLREECGEDILKNEQLTRVENVSHRSDAVSFVPDVKEHSDRFNIDDSDDSVHSQVCSNEKSSLAQLSARSSLDSPIVRHEYHATGIKALHSRANETLSSNMTFEVDYLLGQLECESQPNHILASTRQPSLKLSPSKPQEATGVSEYDLPDWLLGKSNLSPAVSCTKLSMQSPHQIEDEIRIAVDSAAARVNEKLGRQEQFKCELLTAAACSASSAPTNRWSAISKLFSQGEIDLEKHVFLEDELDNVRRDEEVDDDAMDKVRHGDLLLLMEIVIGDGRTETIEIHKGDNPDTLALAFAKAHALQPDARSKLRALIKEQFSALAEKSGEASSPKQPVKDDWVVDAEFDQFVSNSAHLSSVNQRTSQSSVGVNMASHTQPEHQKHERENERESNFNSLKARYAHTSQHSGKIGPEYRRASSSSSFVPQAVEYTPTAKCISMSVSAPRFTTTIYSSRNSSTKKRSNLGAVPAYERLHALAESKDKWIQRAQKAKELEQARNEQQSRRVELMATKSRELVANRSNGGYAHIGERLHEEALSDMAKKVQRHERRVVEREHQHNWMCPKCAFENRHVDSRCQNVMALAQQHSKTHFGKSLDHQETTSNFNGLSRRSDSHSDILCGQPKPERLFQPTLLTSAFGVTKDVTANKEDLSRMQTLRRQRHEKAVAEDFKRTCPFKPKINNVSEEIIREKLISVAEASKSHGETQRSRTPHLDLYENSFQARALRNKREKEYFKQYSFKPDIGVNALWVAPDKSQSDFVERLAVDKFQELERKRVALHEKFAQNRDPSTGKEFFKPEIGRGPAFARNKQGLPIGDFLYGAHLEQQEYHRQLREKKEREIKKKTQQTFVSEVSRQALERRKIETCSRLFSALLASSHSPAQTSTDSEVLSNPLKNDETQDGTVDIVIPANVNLSAIPPEISRVVAIIFEFANHAPISRNDFISYMDRLVRKVPGISYSHVIFLAEHLDTKKGDRHRHQLESDREAAERKELTFHPVIDKNSREIATKHGRVPGSKVFQALNQYYDHYRERKEQRHKQQQHEFRKSHPFQPTLVTKPRLREPAASAFYDKIRAGMDEDIGNQVLMDTSVSPPAPLQTALASARPCVRPIESEHSRFIVGEAVDNVLKTPENISARSLLLEDTELMSRVLAAINEKPPPLPPTYPMTKTVLSNDAFYSSEDKVDFVRSPEDLDSSAELFMIKEL